MTSVAREAELFIAMCALDNKLDKIVAAIPPFAVNPALMENIKSYSISVLLSSKLGAYKGIVPRDHVIAIIKKHQQRHLGNDFDRDHHAQKELKTVVNYELTQARSDLKKEIHKSMVDNSTIFSLATKVVAGTQCSVTRKVMVTHNNTKYWDHIDARLKMIRDTAGGDQKKIDKAFTTYLQTDRKTYGIDTGYKIDEGSDDHLQQSIDTVIMGDNMAVTSS
ncbi:hypothetical protein B0H34DRAFT_668540 [Crassisporium funariophilum]|nr:hypothetical protein B0H34DRAFT_668540 [Crassisporium funariophilum]